jgi:hypothetical protein
MKALQFFLNETELREYAERFYTGGMEDLELPSGRRLSDYDFILIQFKFNYSVVEEVWGVIPQPEETYGERIGLFQYDRAEWVQDALAWLREKAPYNVIDEVMEK